MVIKWDLKILAATSSKGTEHTEIDKNTDIATYAGFILCTVKEHLDNKLRFRKISEGFER